MGVNAVYWAGAAIAAYGASDAHEARLDAKGDRARDRDDRQAVETRAQERAAAQNVMARRALRKNSLFTGGGDAAAQTTLGVG